MGVKFKSYCMSAQLLDLVIFQYFNLVQPFTAAFNHKEDGLKFVFGQDKYYLCVCVYTYVLYTHTVHFVALLLIGQAVY